MNLPSTEQALAEITDEGYFERLAIAVLREAEPNYRAFLTIGTNLEGKTVKAPVDGIAFVTDGERRRFLAAHHTTTKKSDLSEKWLYDPDETSEPKTTKRKRNQRHSRPLGDVPKTVLVLKKHREVALETEGTLVLTTNQEPDAALVLAVEEKGYQNRLQVDIWSRSRIAHFLDNNPQGQWLRHKFLGKPAERLSRELLRHLADLSLSTNQPPDSEEAWVAREIDETLSAGMSGPVNFLVAQSGHGKTVACYKWLKREVLRGHFALILSDRDVTESVTVIEAVSHALLRLNPFLSAGCASDLFAIVTAEAPLLMMVEDINRSGRASQLAERLSNWGLSAQANKVEQKWRVICPLWPSVLSASPYAVRERISASTIFLTEFAKAEACAAVQARGKSQGVNLSDMQAEAIARELGNDPLLIALFDASKPIAHADAIASYVETEVLGFAEADQTSTAADVRLALKLFCKEALVSRMLDPAWRDIDRWELHAPIKSVLARLAKRGTLLHLIGSSQYQRLGYRHDRVRNRIFADAAIELLNDNELPADVWEDPYFAEIFSLVAVDASVSASFVKTLSSGNALALFQAMRRLPERSARRSEIVSCLHDVLLAKEFHGAGCSQLQWLTLTELGQTDGQDVLDLLSHYEKLGGRGGWQARLRNGDFGSAIELCARLEPATGSHWRDIQIAHAKEKFGAGLTNALIRYVSQTDLDIRARSGALRLAGYLASTELVPALSDLWKRETNTQELLVDYIWAFSQCASKEDMPGVLSGPFKQWAALPEKKEDSQHSTPRFSVAEYGLKWAFKRAVPHNAVELFIETAGESETLRWPLLILLSYMDDSRAVNYTIAEAAKMEKEARANGSFNLFADHLPDHWGDRWKKEGAPTSKQARGALLKIWQSSEMDEDARKIALHVWSAWNDEKDFPIIQASGYPEGIHKQLLAIRLQRGDLTAISEWVRYLKTGNRSYWWQFGRYTWAPEIVTLLNEYLDERAVSSKREYGSGDDADWIISELIMTRLQPEEIEALLRRHWIHLKYSHVYVHVALYAATSVTLDFAKQAILDEGNPSKTLEHAITHFGVRVHGRSGITRLAQLEGLIPYLFHLHDHDVDRLWDECNRLGFYDFRRKHLDSIVSKSHEKQYLDSNETFLELDSMVAQDRGFWLFRWLELFLETGRSSSEILDVIVAWAHQRGGIKQYALLADAVVQIGSRADLDRLNHEIEGAEFETKDIRTNAHFSVRRRTLQ